MRTMIKQQQTAVEDLKLTIGDIIKIKVPVDIQFHHNSSPIVGVIYHIPRGSGNVFAVITEYGMISK